MKAKRINLELAGVHHRCDLCDDIMPGYVDERTMYDLERAYQRNAQYVDADFDLADYAITMYTCRDGCESLESDEIYMLEEVWYCGVCMVKYTNVDEAAECCA